MSEHVHDQRFDGDDPYLRCDCGALWDAPTGRPLNAAAGKPADPPSPLTAKQIVPFLRSVTLSGERLTEQDFRDIQSALDTAEAEVIERGVDLANARAPDAGLRAALKEALRSSQDEWNRAPNEHPGTAYRTLERAVRAALVSSPAPAGLDERVLGALRDAAEQAHGFMHYGPFTDCEAAICVQRFKLSRAATRPVEERRATEHELCGNDEQPVASVPGRSIA